MTDELPLKVHRQEERRAWGYFAAEALQALVLSNADTPHDERSNADVIARRAAEYADALLAQRRRRFKWTPPAQPTQDQP